MSKFNLQQWREDISRRIVEFSKNPIQSLHQSGVKTIYDFLLAGTLLPIAVAYNQDPSNVLPVLVSLLGSTGVNLFTNRLQQLRDQEDMKNAAKLAKLPDTAQILSFITEEFKVFQQAQAALLQENQQEILDKLLEQLQQVGKSHLIDNRVVIKRKSSTSIQTNVSGDQVHGTQVNNHGVMIIGGIQISGNRDVQIHSNSPTSNSDPTISSSKKVKPGRRIKKSTKTE